MALKVEARKYYQDFYFASKARPIPSVHTAYSFQCCRVKIKAFLYNFFVVVMVVSLWKINEELKSNVHQL